MKYWRGFLVAGIVFLCTWALSSFAAAHTQLVDMVYPYITRIIMDFMAAWSADFAGCLWQTLLVFGGILVLIFVVLMLIMRWNPLQLFGWILAVVSLVNLLNVGMYGLNEHAGSIATDIRMDLTDYSVETLEKSAAYYLEQANHYAPLVSRDGNNAVKLPSFEELNAQAAESFHTLTFEHTYPIFSGSTIPVKTLGWADRFEGVTGVTVGLTGESAVNPNVPSAGMPAAICKEMARRMCVYNQSDAEFAAYLACRVNSSEEFVYSGYLIAYRHCINALAAIDSEAGRDALSRVTSKEVSFVTRDVDTYSAFFGENSKGVDEGACNLFVSWYLQEVDAKLNVDTENKFDPMDETDSRLEDFLNPGGDEETP